MLHTRLSFRCALAFVTGFALVVMAQPAVRAQDHAHHVHLQQDKGSGPAPGKVHIKFPDTVLTDHHGNTVQFNVDALGERLVVINFVYTTCTTVCPVQSAIFADLQKRLGERLGKDVSLISVTVDPLRDTPLRLKEFAAMYKAQPGWRFLTGSQQAVEQVLKAFDTYTPNFADHPAAILVGDPRSGEWVRFFGFPSSEQIIGRMTELQAARLIGNAAMRTQ